ncbi:MAG: COX15/CtaA family protein [Myxococcota bacterium]
MDNLAIIRMLWAMRLDRFQKLALATTAATYLLIAVGALVRAAGAGLGCPDWPKCFDRWVPPIDVAGVPAHIDPALFNFTKAWTEYINRLLGVAVGFLILATMVAALVQHRRSPRVLIPTISAFVLVLFQGWLGGQVVSSGLAPLVLTAHLLFALIIVSFLLYGTVCAFFPGGSPVLVEPVRKQAARAALGALLLVLGQVAVGALVRGEVQLLAEAGMVRADWMDALSWVASLHELMAVLVAGVLLLLVRHVFILADRDPWLRGLGWTVLGLLALQVGAGLGLADLGFPRVLQVLHLWAVSLMLGALTALAMLLLRLDPRKAAD